MIKQTVADSFYKTVEELCKELYIKALKDLPPDVRETLQKAYEQEETETGKQVLSTMLENIKIADEKNRLICQDTGIPIYFVKVGNKLSVDFVQLEETIIKGCQRATVEHPLRSSVVSPFKRQNNQNSSGYRIPSIHYDVVQDNDKVEILMVPKGSGSENMSFLKMLIPAEGVRGVKRFVLDTIATQVGANPCPPYIVGVGIGGTADMCVKLAKLAAVTRPIGSQNPDPEMAAFEKEMFEAINELGIGPMGLGGLNSAIAVNVEHAYTHITQNPVAINIQCWPARRAKAILGADGKYELGY
ncbi:fumarate hydratase subunit alpha [Desulfotomaculum arcticum]|uniref:Fumarate hydratase subunit alpha n=1 Tax=Desulfotruncus arcticus DSM 17038 TaxID=1121424 RepID=A0A1I2YP34_9FIRM|nr:fumarate hydratase [Desulfotruncus arcticus]SFH27358.1 fumarate hydratase subunit alpha [Desulfotomaculum arcticum] [Desulfotruncus arcticus DSM 17038]